MTPLLSRRALLAATAIAAVHRTHAQAPFPTKPIQLQVPFSPGSGNDLVARAIAKKLPDFLGQPIVVENRAGASGTIASEYTRRAAPDGHTLVLASVSFSVNPHITGAKYTASDFTAVCRVGSLPFTLLVNKSVPASNVKELVERVRANPRQYTGGQGDVNGATFFLMEQLKKTVGTTEVVSAPYKGTPEAILDLQAERIQMMFAPISTALPHHRAGAVKILGVSGAQRSPIMAEMPTFTEQGFPKLDLSTWFGLLGPTGMPAQAAQTMSQAVAKTLASPDVVEALLRIGVSPAHVAPAEFDSFLKADMAMWGALVKESGTNKTN